MSRKDILKVSKNTAGRDLIIGDVHGSASALEAVLNSMGPHDRLFIVGDLLDRGEDSARVIQLIRDKNAGKDPAVVYVVKGNHEELFLDAMKFLNDTASSYDFQSGTTRHPLLNFLQNGGEWIYNDDAVRQEIQECFATRQYAALLKYLEDKTKVLRGDLADIQAQIDPLPYVILAGETTDPDAFVICHADRPPTLTDEKLNERIAADGMLTEEEKRYSAWARLTPTRDRQPVIVESGEDRNEASSITYCGHNAMFDESDATGAVRGKTNTINLDFGTCVTNGFVVVDHTNKKASVVSAKTKTAEAFLTTAADAITKHLALNPKHEHGFFHSKAALLYFTQGLVVSLSPSRKSVVPQQGLRFFRSACTLEQIMTLPRPTSTQKSATT